VIRYDVAVVGGGFSGCMVAANLAAVAVSDFSVAVFEPEALGRGAAYGTKHREHLLNTRASHMSAFAEDSQHFVRWLGSRAAPADFVSRRLYGDYLAEIAERALERPGFSHVRGRVTSVEPWGEEFVVETASGSCSLARAVVLATGNPLPEDRFLPAAVVQHPGYVADPWRFDYSRVGGRVLLIGSGLTALDALVALEAGGHRGRVEVVSRHGRFPETHADGVEPFGAVPAVDASGARAALRSVRAHVREARERGIDWRAVIDAIRPETELLWRRLPGDERKRFERHLRGRWERHRHRAPAQIDAVRDRLISRRRLACHRGEIVEAAGSRVVVARPDGERVTLHPDWIVNCTGAGRVERALRELPLAGLYARGLIEPEPLGYGIRADADFGVLNVRGRRVDRLWAIGPLVRGLRFEATAVPELRAMAHTVALTVYGELRSSLTLTG